MARRSLVVCLIGAVVVAAVAVADEASQQSSNSVNEASPLRELVDVNEGSGEILTDKQAIAKEESAGSNSKENTIEEMIKSMEQLLADLEKHGVKEQQLEADSNHATTIEADFHNGEDFDLMETAESAPHPTNVTDHQLSMLDCDDDEDDKLDGSGEEISPSTAEVLKQIQIDDPDNVDKSAPATSSEPAVSEAPLVDATIPSLRPTQEQKEDVTTLESGSASTEASSTTEAVETTTQTAEIASSTITAQGNDDADLTTTVAATETSVESTTEPSAPASTEASSDVEPTKETETTTPSEPEFTTREGRIKIRIRSLAEVEEEERAAKAKLLQDELDKQAAERAAEKAAERAQDEVLLRLRIAQQADVEKEQHTVDELKKQLRQAEEEEKKLIEAEVREVAEKAKKLQEKALRAQLRKARRANKTVHGKVKKEKKEEPQELSREQLEFQKRMDTNHLLNVISAMERERPSPIAKNPSALERMLSGVDTSVRRLLVEGRV